MKEQLKQAIEGHFIFPESKIGAKLCLNDPSILRHADPEIMKQAGWVREEEIRRRLEIIMSEPNGQVRETMISNLLI